MAAQRKLESRDQICVPRRGLWRKTHPYGAADAGRVDGWNNLDGERREASVQYTRRGLRASELNSDYSQPACAFCQKTNGRISKHMVSYYVHNNSKRKEETHRKESRCKMRVRGETFFSLLFFGLISPSNGVFKDHNSDNRVDRTSLISY